MKWGIPKCHVLEPDGTAEPGKYYLSEQEIGVVDSALYLGVTLRGTKISVDKNISRVKAAMQRLNLLKAVGIHRKYVSSAQLVRICRTYVLPLADYAIHLMPIAKNHACALGKCLEDLDYKVAEYALGCIQKEPVRRKAGRIGGRLPRHLKLGKLPDWVQRIRMRLGGLGKRLRVRAHRTRDLMAQQDPIKLSEFRIQNESPSDMTRRDVETAWERLCDRCRRRIPVPDKGLLPVLNENDRIVRDAGIRWYCGTFPGKPDVLKQELGEAEYTRHKDRIAAGMRAKRWNARSRQRTIESLKMFSEVLDGCVPIGRKRARSTSVKGIGVRKKRKTDK